MRRKTPSDPLPHTRARVIASAKRPPAVPLSVYWPHSSSTDDAGRYQVAGLDPGPWAVTAREQLGGATPVPVEIEIHPGANALDLVIRPRGGAEVSGRVVTSAGDPLDGAAVLLRGSGRSYGAVTVADGAFSIPRVEDGHGLAPRLRHGAGGPDGRGPERPKASGP